MELTFLGTGTSQGVPMIGCECEVCRSTDSRDHRLRTSSMVEVGPRRLIIDAGPDFRQQMLRERVARIDGVLITHAHKDHTGGLDDVRAFNYWQHRAVDVYCEDRVQQVLRKDFDYAFASENLKYPGVPQIELHTIEAGEMFSVAGVDVMPIRLMHWRLPIVGFVIGDLCYITDCNAIDDSVIEQIRGCRVLVINALRMQPHISHFSLEQALAVVARVAPQRAYLTHCSHQLGFYSETSKLLPPNVELAYDGLRVQL